MKKDISSFGFCKYLVLLIVVAGLQFLTAISQAQDFYLSPSGKIHSPEADLEEHEFFISQVEDGYCCDYASWEEIYREAWWAIQDNFLYQDRLVDFQHWLHIYDDVLSDEEETETAIKKMLSQLSDKYTCLWWDMYAVCETKTDDDTEDSPPVESRLIDDVIGYIKINTFDDLDSADEVKVALSKLSGARAYIIDLRDNGGGMISQALNVFCLFADEGKFIELRGRSKGNSFIEEQIVTEKEVKFTGDEGKTKSRTYFNLAADKPIVILVNENTASASEMLAGALRDNKSALIVGCNTFGKGIVQKSVTIPSGYAVKVTFANYFFPKGKGVARDKPVQPDRYLSEAADEDEQLDETISIIWEMIAV